jgi:tetratricopeptide (TPR) repeat protein
LFKASGHRTGQALALNSLGWLHASTFAEYDQAIEYSTRAQRLYQEVDHKLGEAATWDHLGYAHRGLGNQATAAQCYRKALELYQELNDLYYQALMLQNLGDIEHDLGDLEAAGGWWELALDLLTELNHPTAEVVDSKLRSIDS